MQLRRIIDDLLQDVRYAVRTLRRDAGLTIFAVLIVGLGIGASVTVFSISDALLIRPLPFRSANELVWIGNSGPTGTSIWNTQVNHFLDLSQQSKSFAGLAGYFGGFGVGDNNLTGSGDPERLSAVQVTQDFFPVLGVTPIVGRSFSADESSGTGARVAMMSHGLWSRRFASDPTVIGRVLTINDAPVTVVGVLPDSFDFGSVFSPGSHIDLFTPFPLTEATNRWGNTLAIVGRLKPGVQVGPAIAEVNAIGKRLTADHPERNGFNPKMTTLRQHVSGSLRSAMTLLAFGVGVVMLIVCANLSNLLLARATTRQQEVAIRAALGARRSRQMRQMLTESLVLAAAGGVLGISLAFAGTRAIARLSAITLPLLQTVHIDGLSLVFALSLALAAGMLFGLAPALQIPAAAIHDSLRASGRSATDGGARQWTRNVLVVSEIALACVLLVGAGLLSRSFMKVLDVDLGFRPEHVAALRVDPDRRNKPLDETNAYYSDVLARVKQIPGVTNAAITDALPLSSERSWSIGAKGHVYAPNTKPETYMRVVTDGYLKTMGIRVVEGRDFTEQDTPQSEPVALVNETAARVLWPGEDAIGKIIANGGDDRRVVGIVRDVRHAALEKESGNEMYMPMRQTGNYSSASLVVRGTLSPGALASSIRAALSPIAPELSTNEIRTLDQVVDAAVSPRRFFTLMLGGFAVFAVGLALLGIYGVISYTVTQRTQEIAIRMALGASATQLQGRIIRQTLGLAAIGMALGTVASWALARTLGGFLFGVTTTDPLTFVAMLAIIVTAAALGGYIPARRASRIDPMLAIRA
jgi:predicted permease